MAVPHTGSEAWTAWLGRELGEQDSWRPWYVRDQVVGYVVHYKGLVYATVRGAGHMVPETKPEEALALFSRFIADLRL
jgi:serine carboxypeptidase-like clade 1